jgi:F-type H+-transporting ATPase subunit gamma
MAGGQERILRRRIKSIQSTKKITRAMELIAASRIVKAQQRVLAARPYSEQITAVIQNLAAGGAGLDHPLLTPRPDVRKVAYVVITADRGLAGAYNSNVIRAAERALKAEQGQGHDYSLVLVGRKGQGYFRYRGYRVDAAFSGMSDQPTYENAREVASVVSPMFEAGEVDRVELAYTQFLSAGTQKVVVRPFMPLDPEVLGVAEGQVSGPTAAYEYEPSPEAILTRLLPRYAEARLFAAMLDAAASEHAARQRAMKSATDNAEDLIVGLTRVMNRARQDAITTEIMEIVGGAEALAQSGGRPESIAASLVRDDLLPDVLDPTAPTRTPRSDR